MKTVLIVDDDQFILEYIEGLLSPHYTTVTACDGEEGFKKFKENKFDLIITDLVMPIVDGYKLIDQIKAEHSDIPIVVVTGAWDEVKERLSTYKLQGVITKPFKSLTFVQCIQKVLGDKISSNIGLRTK